MDIRAGRFDRRGGGWGRTRRSQPYSFRGAILRGNWGSFLLAVCGSSVRLIRGGSSVRTSVGRGREQTGSKFLDGQKPGIFCLPLWGMRRGRCGAAAKVIFSLGCPPILPMHRWPTSRRRKAERWRPRRADRARAARVRDRPAVAPQPAAFPHIAERRGDRGGAGRSSSPAPPSCCSGRARWSRGSIPSRSRRRWAAAASGRCCWRPPRRAALARGCRAIRLEVHETNHAAISRYRKSGYREFGRHRRYYEDGGDALRFEKRLVPNLAALSPRRPIFTRPPNSPAGRPA